MGDIRKSITAILARETSMHTFAGTGFVTGDVIVTCAHVFSAAREKDGSLRVKFDGGENVPAKVLLVSSADEHDIAILKPDSIPPGVAPLPLAFAAHCRDDAFETYGFPELSTDVHMLAGKGDILAILTDINNSPILQLQSEQVTNGYSGSPVWDKTLGAVVGVVNSGIKLKLGEAHHGTAFATPCETLKELYPALDVLTLQPPTGQTAQRDNAPTFTPEPYQPADEPPEPGTLPPGSRMYFGRNGNFTGRVDDLFTLADVLLANHKSGALTVTQTLSGMGGIGKTQLAVEFCYRYGHYFHAVHWMDARGTLESEIAACGAAMDLPNWPQTTPEQVELTLRVWKAAPKRLLVLDNLEEPQVLRQWKAHFEGMSVLVTSRNQRWDSDLALVHPIGTLARAESLALLRKLAPHLASLPNAELDAVPARLGDLPLALDLAGRYMHERGLAPQAYLDRLRDVVLKHRSLKNEKSGSPIQHDTDVERAFLLSWEQLGEDEVDTLAKRFFISSGYVAPNVPIPKGVFLSLSSFIFLNGKEEREKEVDDEALEEMTDDALLRLRQLGLLTETLSQHPLLAEFARAQDDDHAAMTLLADRMATLSNRALETGIPADFYPLRPHLETLAPQVEAAGLAVAGAFWNNLGSHQGMVAEYYNARAAYERALAIDEKI